METLEFLGKNMQENNNGFSEIILTHCMCFME